MFKSCHSYPEKFDKANYHFMQMYMGSILSLCLLTSRIYVRMKVGYVQTCEKLFIPYFNYC